MIPFGGRRRRAALASQCRTVTPASLLYLREQALEVALLVPLAASQLLKLLDPGLLSAVVCHLVLQHLDVGDCILQAFVIGNPVAGR